MREGARPALVLAALALAAGGCSSGDGPPGLVHLEDQLGSATLQSASAPASPPRLPVVDVWLVTKNVIGCAVGAEGEESLLQAPANTNTTRSTRFKDGRLSVSLGRAGSAERFYRKRCS